MTKKTLAFAFGERIAFPVCHFARTVVFGLVRERERRTGLVFVSCKSGLGK